jgi:hypothetical protein
MEDGCSLGCLWLMVIGIAVAVVLSWSANHSILWMIIHGVLSWFYVIYYVWNNDWS